MHIIKDKDQYFSLIKGFQYIPYTQSEGWFQFHTCMKPDSILFFVDNMEFPRIACFGHIKRFWGLKMLLIEGECFRQLPIESRIVKGFFEELQSLNYDMVETNSILPYQAEYEIGIRQAGFLRPVGHFSMHLSSWIDLTQGLKFNSNWKRNLKLAENSALDFRYIEVPNQRHASDFVSIYQEMAYDKSLNHSLSKKQVESLLSTRDFGLATVTDKYNNLLSAIIFHQSGQHAGLLYAAKSSKAKDCGATFYMYKELLTALSEKGILSFDMEKLLPSTHSTNGVFLFKQGIRGSNVIYNGEWSWYKHPSYRLLMYFVKRFLMKKMEV